MLRLIKRVAKIAAVSACLIAGASFAAEPAPTGAWRTTNDCFLAGFVLNDDGTVQAAYLSGERDITGKWTWDGRTLVIASMMFPLDKFSGHLAGERLEADYVWHDLDNDKLNTQSCTFERFGF
jgi:hypothetical protein